MALVMTSPAAVEPVSLAEAKADLRVDGTADDNLIRSLIVTSRLHIEAALGLALITQSWQLLLDAWPKSRRVPLPMRPIRDVSAVGVRGDDDSLEAVPPSAFILDGTGNPARLVWRNAATAIDPGRPVNGIEITFTAGFGDTPEDVPAPIRHALVLLVAHWYEHREPVEIGAAATAIPSMVSELLLPYRRRRL